MEKYKSTDLKKILDEMTSYVEYNDKEVLDVYFMELINTRLFHDAIGRVIVVTKTDDGHECKVRADF